MKLTIETKTLRDAIHRIAQLPGAAGSIIYTQIVRLTADLNGLNLLRFSGIAKISVTVEEGLVIEDEGEAKISFEDFSKFAAQMPGEKVTIFCKSDHLFMSSGNFKGKLAQITADVDVEPNEDELEAREIRMPIDDLQRWLASVAPGMGKDLGREALMAVAIKPWKGKMCFCASDSKIGLIRITDYDADDVDALIPALSVDMLVKALDKQEGACVLAIGLNTIRVTSANIEVTTALSEKGYPDLEKALDRPESSIQSKVAINRAEAVEGFRNLGKAFNKEISRLEITELELTISAQSEEKGAQVKLRCEATKPLVVGINPDRFADALNFVNAEDGNAVQVVVYQGCASIMQKDRLAFAVLSKEPKSDK